MPPPVAAGAYFSSKSVTLSNDNSGSHAVAHVTVPAGTYLVHANAHILDQHAVSGLEDFCYLADNTFTAFPSGPLPHTFTPAQVYSVINNNLVGAGMPPVYAAEDKIIIDAAVTFTTTNTVNLACGSGYLDPAIVTGTLIVTPMQALNVQ